MKDSNSLLEIVSVVMGAILAYGFGRYQHMHEYKEDLKNKIFDNKLYIDLPNAYSNFIDNPTSAELYFLFGKELKSVVEKCAVLKLRNKKKYKAIEKIVEVIDELSAFNTYHIVDGVKVPVEITEISQIEKRKKEINRLMLKLYRNLGTDSYRNILYAGPLKLFVQWIMDIITERIN